jgi:dolichol-phosphate mannosyltransferase
VHKSIVIIPTYNEKDNVERIIQQVLTYATPFDILVVDDNSPDGTATIVEKLQETYPDRIFLEKRAGKLGLGTAYIHGFKWSLKNNYDYIFEMDCDFSHNPDDLERLLHPLIDGKYQLSIGSRYCSGGKIQNWPVSRVLLSYFASIYVRLILWMNIKDTTAGFMCYHKDVLASIDFEKVHFKGYAFQICMKYAALKNGFKLIEVPITFKDRQFGESKMSTGIFKEALIGVWQMRKIKFK